MIRTFLALTVIAAIGTGLHAQQKEQPPTVGNHLVIKMTGDLAKEYRRRIGPSARNPPDGLEIETTATIAQQFGDGRIRFEHSMPVRVEGKPARLVTLTGTIDATKVATHVTPKGTAVYASPAEHKAGGKAQLVRKETRTRRVELSDLKGLKLRTWTLSEEIGD